MITSNLKNKIIVTVKENINKFSYKVDGVAKEKEHSSIEAFNNKIKVNLMLDNTDVGKIQDIKLLDYNNQVLFETNAVYYKESQLGIYISFEISDILEVA
jgi:hypothetical protein